MSPKEMGLITAVAVAALAMLFLLCADISSADPGCDDPCRDILPEPMQSPEQRCAEPVQQHQSPDATEKSPVRGAWGMKPETAVPGGAGMNQFGCEPSAKMIVQNPYSSGSYTAPSNRDIYNAVIDAVGDGSQIVVDDDGVTVYTLDVDDSVIDDEFLYGLADDLEGVCPDVAGMIRSVMDLRTYMATMSRMQDFETSSSSSSGRKTESVDSDETTEETDCVTVEDDDETDAEDGTRVVAPVSAAPSTPCDEVSAPGTTASVEERCMWTVHGPVL